jgi:hypothetical protein
MKMITSLFAVTLLVASAASAMADQQRSDEAPGYALGWQASRGSPVHRGPYASDWSERSGGARASASAPVVHDFGNDPNVIHFQAQGSH